MVATKAVTDALPHALSKMGIIALEGTASGKTHAETKISHCGLTEGPDRQIQVPPGLIHS